MVHVNIIAFIVMQEDEAKCQIPDINSLRFTGISKKEL